MNRDGLFAHHIETCDFALQLMKKKNNDYDYINTYMFKNNAKFLSFDGIKYYFQLKCGHCKSIITLLPCSGA